MDKLDAKDRKFTLDVMQDFYDACTRRGVKASDLLDGSSDDDDSVDNVTPTSDETEDT